MNGKFTNSKDGMIKKKEKRNANTAYDNGYGSEIQDTQPSYTHSLCRIILMYLPMASYGLKLATILDTTRTRYMVILQITFYNFYSPSTSLPLDKNCFHIPLMYTFSKTKQADV